MTNPQRKIIKASRQTSNQTELAVNFNTITFDSSDAVNVHGVNISIGVSPAGPDETLVGRWYVIVMPPSIAGDATTLNAWVDQLDTIALANTHLESSEFVWGAGTIMCAEQSTFQHTFSPKTSRNVKKGATIFVVVVADAISGVIDDWDFSAMTSLFTS